MHAIINQWFKHFHSRIFEKRSSIKAIHIWSDGLPDVSFFPPGVNDFPKSTKWHWFCIRAHGRVKTHRLRTLIQAENSAKSNYERSTWPGIMTFVQIFQNSQKTPQRSKSRPLFIKSILFVSLWQLCFVIYVSPVLKAMVSDILFGCLFLST